MTEITLLIPHNQVIKYPQTGDKILYEEVVYTANVSGIFGESKGMVPVEWVDFAEIKERLSMHDFLNCFIWSEEEIQWVIRPNLEKLMAEARGESKDPEEESD